MLTTHPRTGRPAPRRSRATFVALLTAALGGAIACGDDDGPTDSSGGLAGTYRLVSAAGVVPPVYFDCGEAPLATCTESATDWVRFDTVLVTLSGNASSGDVTARLWGTTRVDGGAPSIVGPIPGAGTYSVSGSTVTITATLVQGSSISIAATREGNELRGSADVDFDGDAEQVIFRKQ